MISFQQLIFWIGALDALVIMGLGLIGAGLVVSGKESEVFTQRVLPACGIVVGTSLAAGIVVLAASWMAAGPVG